MCLRFRMRPYARALLICCSSGFRLLFSLLRFCLPCRARSENKFLDDAASYLTSSEAASSIFTTTLPGSWLRAVLILDQCSRSACCHMESSIFESDWKHVNGAINRGNRAVDREIETVLEKGTKQTRNLFVRCLDPLLCPTLHARRWEEVARIFIFHSLEILHGDRGSGRGRRAGNFKRAMLLRVRSQGRSQ